MHCAAVPVSVRGWHGLVVGQLVGQGVGLPVPLSQNSPVSMRPLPHRLPSGQSVSLPLAPVFVQPDGQH